MTPRAGSANDPPEVTRVLVAGLPRSGTTWVASILARTDGAVLVMEPDNQYEVPAAARAKRRLPGGFYPALAPVDRAPRYEALWRDAFGARGARFGPLQRVRRDAAQRLLRRVGEPAVRASFSTPRDVPLQLRAAELLAVAERPAQPAGALIVKSVYAPLSVEWIAARLAVPVVIVFRDLLNVLSSWVALDWLGEVGSDELSASDPDLQEELARRHGVPPAPVDASPLARAAWLLGVLTLALEAAVRDHPEWHVVRHEELLAQPADALRPLAARLGLRWSAATDDALAATNRPGSGYAIERVAGTLEDVWRSRLTAGQLADIAAVLGPFPLQTTDVARVLAAAAGR